MSKTYNLYIQKSNTKYPTSQEVEEAKFAQKFAIGVYSKFCTKILAIE